MARTYMRGLQRPKRFTAYVGSICYRNDVRLEAVGNKVKLAQGESDRILLAVPRETWLYREMASRPWDPRLVTSRACVRNV